MSEIELIFIMDKLTPEQRKKNMKANKSSGTRPELVLAHELWKKGFRYRKNDKSVFGRPDFTFKRYKIAIFVDGEFWHGKEWELRKHDFKSRQEFWITKIENNIMRDQLVSKTLGLVGWKVLRFWSKEVLRNLDSCMSKIEQTINESKQKTTNEI